MYSIDRLTTLQRALDLEFDYEKKIYEETLKTKSIKELVEDGLVWYPLQIIETGYTVGEYPYLTLEIDEAKIVQHQFKSGSMIRFFQNVDGNIQLNSERASVYYISQNQIKIILDTDDLPDWYSDGKIGISTDYDEKSIKEMRVALKEVIEAKNSTPLAELRDKFYGIKPTHAIQGIPFFSKNQSLNPSQITAVENMLGMDDFLVIHGPPGTGKTTTLVEGIYQLTKKEKQVLVCSPSNSAVDLLVEKLAQIGLKVLRIGNISRVNEDILSQTLDFKIDASPEMLEIKKLRKKAAEFRKMANKYKRQFGPEEREQRKLLINEAKDIHKHIRWIEDYLVKKIMEETQAICTTLVGSQNKYLNDIKFQTVIIDEVSQALEPATWIPILKAEKVILAGDPFQLPPTIKSQEAEKLGFSTTLLDVGFEIKNRVMLLDTQYRMKEEIMGFSNLVFYQNKLKAAENTHAHFFQIKDTIYPSLKFIDTAGCGFDEQRNTNTESLFNPEESKLLFDYLSRTLLELKYQYDDFNVGIIAPYREQVEYMKRYDREFSQLKHSYDIDISTIDSFQGQERDIIFLSLVRSNYDGNLGFLKDYRRINVALTRARKMLVVFGDSATLSQDKFYGQWLDYCEKIGAYQSAWEVMEN
jgi:ATP-dependent RNA/DNA helicase IGHMBP2